MQPWQASVAAVALLDNERQRKRMISVARRIVRRTAEGARFDRDGNRLPNKREGRHIAARR